MKIQNKPTYELRKPSTDGATFVYLTTKYINIEILFISVVLGLQNIADTN